MPLLKSSELTSGRTFRRMTSPAMVGLKFSLTPNSLNMTVTVPVAALHDGHRKLAAREEARFLAVVGDQVRLGERLEEALLLERLDGGAETFLPIEEEQVQEIAEDEPARLLVVEVGRRELLRRAPVRSPSDVSRRS